MIKFVFIFLIIYILLWLWLFTKLHKVEKKALISYLFTKNKFKETHNVNDLCTKFKLIYLGKLLILPFLSKYYYYYYFKGIPLGVTIKYVNKKYNFDGSKIDNKLYWYFLFKKYKINHPKLYAYNVDNKVKKITRLNDNKYYLIKPINGTGGNNIKKMKGKDINISKLKNYIVQQLLNDCTYDNTRSFRFISIYNGNKFLLYEITNEKSISSNFFEGKNTNSNTLCDFFRCKRLSHIENMKMRKIISQLSLLHKIHFNYVLFIGWDIMLNCENNDISTYVLEGNTTPAIFLFNTYAKFIKNKSILKSYLSHINRYYYLAINNKL